MGIIKRMPSISDKWSKFWVCIDRFQSVFHCILWKYSQLKKENNFGGVAIMSWDKD